ncbi:MAG TPA: biopolymer transporter ExbD [Verrucomicrobiae bacterium]|nr:biopolymer transporter ExbD [Verrucomicrobiae bacterium]
MRPQRHADETGGHTGIDLAPMLDFVLNLLIFFIITTSFIKEHGTQVNKADAVTAAAQRNGNILIAIRPNGDVWLDRKQVDVRDVRNVIERMHNERPEDTVVIIADKESQTGVLTQVMDQVRSAGVETVSIAANKPN